MYHFLYYTLFLLLLLLHRPLTRLARKKPTGSRGTKQLRASPPPSQLGLTLGRPGPLCFYPTRLTNWLRFGLRRRFRQRPLPGRAWEGIQYRAWNSGQQRAIKATRQGKIPLPRLGLDSHKYIYFRASNSSSVN